MVVKGVVGGMGFDLHARVRDMLRWCVCALQTRVLGTLCVPSSGETRALLSFISVISICLFFPREKRCKIFEKFWDVFYPLFGRLYLLHA